MMIDFHHPLEGSSHPLADYEGHGRDGLYRAPVPDLSPSDARGGGLPERSPGSPAFQNRAASDSDHPVLKHARAC